MAGPLKGSRRANTMPSKAPATAKAARKVPSASKDTTWDVEELKNMLYPPGDSENPDLKVDAVDSRKGLKAADEVMNKASSAFTTLISGKKGAGTGKEVEAIAKACRIALDGYRKWSDRKLDIERRASSLASKLITLEAYVPARQVLDDMRPHVLALYDHAPPNTSSLTLPLPLQELPDELVHLLTNTLVHRVWTNRDEDGFVSDLMLEGSISSWVALSAGDTLKRAFTALSKSKHFSARIVGLKCVVNTAELDPDAFWGQACYYASTFAKTITDKNEERRVCAEVSNAYGDLVALAASRENFLEGEIFVKFCKFWLSFARKLKDVGTIEKISIYLQGAPAQDPALETAQMCARLLRITTGLRDPAVELIAEIQQCPTLLSQTGNKKVMLNEQVISEIDKLRKACADFFDRKPDTASEITKTVAKLIIALIRTDRLHSSLDSLYVLSKSVIHLADSKSWDTSFSYLKQATALLLQPKVLELVTEAQLANLWRVTGNAFYNIGGKLYNAERYGGAAAFIKQAGILFEDAVARIESCKTKEDAGKAEDWDNCRRRLPQVWEALGRCNYKIGHLRDAYDAYSTSLKHSLQNTKRTLPLSDELTLMIERVTHLGIVELCLPADAISLREVLFQSPLKSDPAMIAEVLECQIHIMRTQLKKEGVSGHVKTLMKECASLYGNEMPVRRAKALLRMMEFAYQQDEKDFDAESLCREIQQIADTKSLSRDRGLEFLQRVYPVCTEIWITFINYRESSRSSSAGSEMAESLSRVCAKLREWKPISAQTTCSAKGEAPPAVKGPAAKRKPTKPVAAAVKRNAGKKKAAAVNPVPPEKVASPEITSLLRDEMGGVFTLIESCASLAGLMGFLVPHLQILTSLKAMTGEYAVDHAETHTRVSITLALQLQRLGLRRSALRIFSSLREVLRNKSLQLSDQTELLFHLRYAEVLGEYDLDESSKSYLQAQKILSSIPAVDKKTLSRKAQVANRIELLAQTALAAATFATLSDSSDDSNAALKASLQSMRLWGRAAEVLHRAKPASPKDTPRSPSPNPFQVTDLKEAIDDVASGINGVSKPEKPQLPSLWLEFHRGPSPDGVEWRVAEGLLCSMFMVARYYLSRGSVKAAQRYLIDVEALASSLGSPGMHARALARKAELLLKLGEYKEAYTNILTASQLLTTISGPERADIHRLHGMHHEFSERTDEADDMYGEAMIHLQTLEKKISTCCGDICSTVEGVEDEDEEREVFLGHLVSLVLRESVWLYRDDQDDHFTEGLTLLSASSQTALSKGELSLLLGKLGLFNGLNLLHGTLSLSSLTESTISVSNGLPERAMDGSASIKEILPLLKQADDNFQKAILAILNKGDVSDIRDSFISSAMIRVYQTALGSSTVSDPAFLAMCLDRACSITLRREMLETIDGKLAPCTASDDLEWPSVEKHISVPTSPSILEDDKQNSRYWETVRLHYGTDIGPSEYQASINKLPENWTVVTIAITDDANSLLVTRQRPGQDPIVLCIPLERHGRKDEDEDQQLSYSDAMAELKEIISTSNAQAQNAKSVVGNQALKIWWAERGALDARLKKLLENIEFCWLGAFKTVLDEPRHPNPELLDLFRQKMVNVFTRFVSSTSKGSTASPLNDALVECFLSLSPKSRDEELEDFIYFVLDLYQFQGVPVALAELDIDEIVVELRLALEDFSSKARDQLQPIPDSHLFLVLDKNMQGLPWESLPILKGKSISRIPCLPFLIDRLALPSFDNQARGMVIDPSRTYYVINPSGDLKHTQDKFKDWAASMHNAGWRGIVGRKPMELEMTNGLEKSDLFLYFGHGNGEQFISSRKIRALKRCAATLLWGCSSGAMKEMGQFDRIGTPNHYMVAGCPTLVANLWDVTDKDLDKFTEATFKKLGLNQETVTAAYNEGPRPGERKGVSIAAALAQSRTACKMEYLVGASPVVYGIPFYL